MREITELQDEAFAYALTCVRPGRRDRDIYADVLHKCLELGGEQTNIMVGSAPPGTPARNLPVHFGNRMIQQGDQVFVLVESNGPSGYFAEVGRFL